MNIKKYDKENVRVASCKCAHKFRARKTKKNQIKINQNQINLKSGKKLAQCLYVCNICINVTRTVVPYCFIACCANVVNLSRYNVAARELYFCCASVVMQLCCRKNCDAFALPPNCICRN